MAILTSCPVCGGESWGSGREVVGWRTRVAAREGFWGLPPPTGAAVHGWGLTPVSPSPVLLSNGKIHSLLPLSLSLPPAPPRPSHTGLPPTMMLTRGRNTLHMGPHSHQHQYAKLSTPPISTKRELFTSAKFASGLRFHFFRVLGLVYCFIVVLGARAPRHTHLPPAPAVPCQGWRALGRKMAMFTP